MLKEHRQLAALIEGIPKTKMKIHHDVDLGLHFMHKTNITLRNVNNVIKLIFKNTKEHQAIVAISQGTKLESNAAMPSIDENRIKEIQKVANAMKVYIPKRFDSKLQLREFIQSREFIMGMKSQLTKQMFACIN